VARFRLGARRSRAIAWLAVMDLRLARFLGVFAIAMLALILGYIGLNEYLSHQTVPQYGTGWADILFYDLQLLVFNAAPTQGAGPFPVALGVARFLAPATTALATLETLRLLLSEQLRRWAAASGSRHAIVTGDGPIPIELGRKLRADYRKVVLITTSQTTATQARRHRLLDVLGDPTDAATLRAAGLSRADALYACSHLSTTNAATALRAREVTLVSERPLAAYAQVRDAELSTALRARRIGAGGDLRFSLDFFTIEDIAARMLLSRYPISSIGVTGKAQRAKVVIVGFGQLGQAILQEVARSWIPGEPAPEVLVCHPAAAEVAGFRKAFPVIDRNCEVTVGDMTEVASAAPCLVFVCLADNDEALREGLAVAHALASGQARVVICLSEPSPFGAPLSGHGALLDDVEGRVSIFGVIEEACMPELIREDLTDQLARAIHRAYVAQCAARGETPQVNKSMVPWESLSEDLRQANRAQAARIGTKLEAIDCAVVPESAIESEFCFTAEEIEYLAQLEHESWMQKRREQGYLWGPSRQGRQTHDMVDWSYLSEAAREKDRDAVRGMPATLHEAGFQILRLPRGS
jgi:voltage-gated potassium channel Kch